MGYTNRQTKLHQNACIGQPPPAGSPCLQGESNRTSAPCMVPLAKRGEPKGGGQWVNFARAIGIIGDSTPDNPIARVSGFEQTDTHHRSKDESPAKRAIAPNRGYISGFGCI